MSDEMGFGSFATSDEPVKQVEQPSEAPKKSRTPKVRSSLLDKSDAGTVDVEEVGKKALELQNRVGPAKAAEPKAATALEGFTSNLKDMALGAGALALLFGIPYGAKKLFSDQTAPLPPSATGTEPTFTPEPTQPAAQPTPEAMQQKLAEARAAQAAKVPQAPAAPVAPVAPATPVETAANMVAGETPAQAAVVNTTEKAAEVSAKTRVRGPAAPPLDPNLPFNRQYNKNPSNMGPGAWNWLAGQEGQVKAQPVWKDIVGEGNISYKDFMEKKKPIYEAYQGSYGEPDPFKAQSVVGENPKSAYVPKNIKGGITPKVAGALAVLGIAPAAYAALKGNYGEAAVRGLDVATDVTPVIGQLKAALTPTSLSPNEQEEINYRRRREEAAKLGAANRGKAFDPRRLDLGINPQLYGY